MAIPKVKLRRHTSFDGSTFYVLDYRVNGKRIRKKVGTNKRDAEPVRSKTEHELLFSQFKIQAEKQQISRDELVQQSRRGWEPTVDGLILNMEASVEQIIERIYETGQVVGRNGEVHKLTSAIDRREGEFLFDTIHNDPGIAETLEVGCAYGLSSLCICTATRGRAGASHTIIDPFETTYWDGAGIRNLEEAGIDFFDLIEDKSEIGLPRLLPERECQFDLIFVDGFHTFDYTLLDCFYATRLLRVGGYLVIDDVSFPSVRRVVDFLKNYPCYEEHGSVAEKRPKSWKSIIARILLSPVARRVWTKILSPGLYRRIFEEQNVSMVALKKIAEDTRNWDWHNDAF